MNIIIKNVSSLLKTDNTELLSILRKKYSAKQPGYQYSKAYSRGWDGSKYFITPGGVVGTGLVPFIVDDLKTAELDYTIVDEREPPLDSPNTEVPKITYRDYQQNLINLALKNRMGIIKAPTGSGKTVILAGLLKAFEDMRGVIFFTQKGLLLQTYDFLKDLGFDVGIVFGEGVDIKPITLCTVQSVHKIIDSHLDTAEFIIFDEVHEFSKGKLSTKVVKSFPQASYRYGMTATVPSERLAKLNLVSYLGPVISEVDVQTLVRAGFLTPPIIKFMEVEEYKDDACTFLTYPEIYDKYVVHNEYRNKVIQNICDEIVSGNVLILVKNLKHLEILRDLIPGSITLEGKDDVFTRKEVISAFKKAKRSILIGTKVLQTGIDIPEITHFINARGLKSEIATIQALGRALRIHRSKDVVHIYDFNDQVPYLKEHALARRRAYKSLNVEVTNGNH